MELCIIADDVTGANDAGVQCARHGYTPAVALTGRLSDSLLREQVLIVNTDSRPFYGEQAYNRVRSVSDALAASVPKIVYKKIDSTLRGAVGAELDAVFDSFQPDFIVVNPSYPAKNRIIKEGKLYVNDIPLQEAGYTTFAGETAVTSSVVEIIEADSKRRAVHLNDDILYGNDLAAVLTREQNKGTAFLSFDSRTEADLQKGMKQLQDSGFSILFAGSAGAAFYLFPEPGRTKQNPVYSSLLKDSSSQSALFVVGSRSNISRKQRQLLMTEPDIVPLSLSPSLFFDQKTRETEIEKVIEQIVHQQPSYSLLYLESGQAAVQAVETHAAAAGITLQEASLYMAEQMGYIVSRIYERIPYDALFLTGGDIASAVCTSLGSDSLELYGEWEPGIPIGRLRGAFRPLVMTKAGGFGNEDSLIQALHFFQGGTNE